ncbi:dTDP-4-dehydrorhamnose 3,5-epimerase [bacterium]|jgi:dTDP-4-dehydrorhamnose 3,5-epimerase|nr:dTDP-4-dehydrorhamnose 3,5-epimerase [bacterium]
MKFTPLSIPDVIHIEPKIFEDNRGFFMEVYHQEKYAEAGISDAFVQDNYSRSSKGTLRGLHYQLHPKAQGKLVRAVKGEILDVAVDIRKGSSTFGQWVSAILSEDKKNLLYVPPGFAHGFYVISDTADIEYKCTSTYSADHERSIRWDDPDINISWPISPDQTVLLSEKDKIAPLLTNADTFGITH